MYNLSWQNKNLKSNTMYAYARMVITLKLKSDFL